MIGILFDRWHGHVDNTIMKCDGIDQGRRCWGARAKGNRTLPPPLCVDMDFYCTIQISSEERMLLVDRWRGHVVDVNVKRDSI